MVACVHTVVIRSPPNAVPSGHRCRAAVGVVGALGGFSFFFRGVSPPLHGSDFRWMRFPLDARGYVRTLWKHSIAAVEHGEA